MITAKNIKRVCFFLLGIMLIALSFGESITLFGFSLSWIFAALISVLMVLHMLISLRTSKKSAEKNKLADRLIIFAVFWLVYALIQGLWAIDMTLWKQGIVSTLINIFIIIVIWYFLKDNNDIDAFLKYSVPLWIVNIGLGLYEAITNNHFIMTETPIQDIDIVRTFLGNPNDCATWMALCFLLLAHYLKRRKVNKIFTVIAWAITTFVVFETESRACFYGMIAYAAVYIISYALIKIEDNPDNGVKKTLFWLFAILILAVIFFGIYGDLISSLIRKFSGTSNQTSDFYRLEIIKDTFQVILNSLFFGVGANQTISYIGINSHNFFLELFADFGIIIVSFTCYMFFKIINMTFNKKEAIDTRAYYISYAISFFIISISSSSMNRLRLTWVSLIVVFLAVCYSDSLKAEENMKAQKLQSKHKNKWVK